MRHIKNDASVLFPNFVGEKVLKVYEKCSQELNMNERERQCIGSRFSRNPILLGNRDPVPNPFL